MASTERIFMLLSSVILGLVRVLCRVVGSTMMTIMTMTHRNIAHRSARSSETLLLIFNEGLFALIMVVLFAYYCWTQVFPYIINVLLPKVFPFLFSILVIYFIGVLCVRLLSKKTTTAAVAANFMIGARDSALSAAFGGNDRTSTKKLNSKTRKQIRATAKQKIDASSEAQRRKIELSNGDQRPLMPDLSGLSKKMKKQKYVEYWKTNAPFLGY